MTKCTAAEGVAKNRARGDGSGSVPWEPARTVDVFDDWESRFGPRMDVSNDWEIKTDVSDDWETESVSQSSETSTRPTK